MEFVDEHENQVLAAIARKFRRGGFETILRAKSGHTGAASSSAELMTALYLGGILRYDPANPRHHSRDRVLARGHLGPLRYNLFAALGWINAEELTTYRQFGSRLQGHESMEMLPGVDITPSGSLGMVLSYGVGCAIALKNQNIKAKVYVFLGDGEEQEGNVSEAARYAASCGLDNIVCILDKNGKQLSGPTDKSDGKTNIEQVWQGYGWNVKIILNGHSIPEIMIAFRSRKKNGKPTLFIAHTIKGLGIRGCDSHPSGYHTFSSCGTELLCQAIRDLKIQTANDENILGPFQNLVNRQLAKLSPLPASRVCKPARPTVELKPSSASDNYDEALTGLLSSLTKAFKPPAKHRLYFLTADWNDQKQLKECNLDAPWVKYLDVGIREQHMMAMAQGIMTSDPSAVTVVFDGDGFIYRAGDQLHAISQAKTPIIIIGTDSGLCEARNGATHQSEGQPGMLLTMPHLALLEPADENDLYICFNSALKRTAGPAYIRLHSGKIAPLYNAKRKLPAYRCYEPKGKVRLNLVTSGIITFHAVKFAINAEKTQGVGIRVINVLEMKQLAENISQLLELDVPTLTVFNGNPFVLQAAVSQALLSQPTGYKQKVTGHGFIIGTTGHLDKLLEHFRLDAAGIENVVHEHFPFIWE